MRNGPLSTTFTIAVTAAPGYAASPTGTTSLCENPANTNYTCATISNANSYNWTLTPSNAGNLTSTNQNAVVDWNNAYTGFANISVMGVNGCGNGTASSDLTVNIRPAPNTPTITHNAGVLESSSNYNNQWFKSNAMINGANQKEYTPTVNGVYSVEVHNSYGCAAMSSSITVSDVGIEVLLNNKEVSVFPNPAEDFVIIQYSGKEEIIINMKNALGKNILTSKFVERTKLDLSHLSSGIYFIEMHIKDKAESTIVKKIIITKK